LISVVLLNRDLSRKIGGKDCGVSITHSPVGTQVSSPCPTDYHSQTAASTDLEGNTDVVIENAPNIAIKDIMKTD
jgi:hypothetical protein